MIVLIVKAIGNSKDIRGYLWLIFLEFTHLLSREGEGVYK